MKKFRESVPESLRDADGDEKMQKMMLKMTRKRRAGSSPETGAM